MKKRQYEESRFKYLLKNSKDLSHKLFRLNEEQKNMAISYGFKPIPVLFRVKTQRSFNAKPKHYLLRVLDSESRKGHHYKVMRLNQSQQNFLRKKDIKFYDYKYQLVRFN